MKSTIVKTSKQELCLVVVPDEAVEIGVYRFAHSRIYYTCFVGEWFCSEVLPEGSWQLIGPLKDITEEQAKEWVDEDQRLTNKYVNYTQILGFVETALESLHSLVASTGLKGNVIILKRTAT